MEEKYGMYQIRDVVGTLLTAIIISITVLNNGLLATLPITVLLAFCLFFVDYKIWWVLTTTFIVHIILGTVVDPWMSILSLIGNIIEICAGFLLALSIKRLLSNWKQPKYIVLGIFSIILVNFAITGNSQSYGTPSGYLKAKNNVMSYISETYNGDLEVTGIRYNSKMSEYIVDVESKKDPRDEGSIFYFRSGHISDDYHFRIEREQEEMIESMFKIILNQKTDISIDEMSLHVGVTLPKNKYSKRDIYSGEEPINVGLTIEPDGPVKYYESKEDFSKEAYKILKTFKELGFSYKNIEIKSFLADGNTTYSIIIEGPIEVDSWERTMDLTEKIEHEK